MCPDLQYIPVHNRNSINICSFELEKETECDWTSEKERFVPVATIREGFAEEVAFDLELERWE